MSLSVSRDHTCSIMRIGNFGGKIPSGYSRSYGYNNNTPAATTLQEFVERLRVQIQLYDENHGVVTANLFANTGLVMVHLAETQVEGCEILKEFGGWTCVSSKNMAKYDHEVLLFVQPICDFIDRFNELAAKFKVRPLPRAEGKKLNKVYS